MLYGARTQHEAVKGNADLIKTWLCTNRPVLQQCKQRATKERQRRSALRRGVPADGSGGDAAAEPAGGEAPAGDDASAAPGISDAGLGTQVGFFEGLGAQVGSSGAALAPRRRSAPPQCCCAAGARPFINEI